MKNTNSCESCSQGGRYTTKEIFGKNVRVKNYICSPDGKNYECKNGDVKLYMSVCPQSYCPASCPFCIATRTKERLRIDTAKFEKTLRGLKDLGLIKSIKITGGEPFYDFELLSEVVEIIFEVFGLGFELSISTPLLSSVSFSTSLRKLSGIRASSKSPSYPILLLIV